MEYAMLLFVLALFGSSVWLWVLRWLRARRWDRRIDEAGRFHPSRLAPYNWETTAEMEQRWPGNE